MTIFASRPCRLDRRVKELTQEKEEFLKSSKVQSTTTESVKVQIETLLKVRLFSCLSALLLYPTFFV